MGGTVKFHMPTDRLGGRLFDTLQSNFAVDIQIANMSTNISHIEF